MKVNDKIMKISNLIYKTKWQNYENKGQEKDLWKWLSYENKWHCI